MTLGAHEFIRRFMLHVIPEGFVPACACRTQTGASATLAFWPTALKNRRWLNAANFSGLIPLCLKALIDQPAISCWKSPASILVVAPVATKER